MLPDSAANPMAESNRGSHGSGQATPDRFSISASPDVQNDDDGGHGEIVFHAEGDVANGDISIGAQN